MPLCREELGPAASLPHRRQSIVFLEYILLEGVNDSEEDARRVAGLMAGLAAKINLICFNAHPGTPFTPSPRERVLAFRNILAQAGVTATIRESRGGEELAACGQLGGAQMAGGRMAAGPPMLRPPPRFRERFEVGPGVS